METDKDQFDLSKILDFPGYNVAPKRKYHEEHKKFNAPPMLPFHSKEFMIEALHGRIATAYKRTKMTNHPGAVDKSERTTKLEVSMDVEDGEVEIDEDLLPPGCDLPEKLLQPIEGDENPPPSTTDLKDKNGERTDSPTLNDLEEKQQKLLDALNSSELGNTTTEMVWQVIDETNDKAPEDGVLEANITINSEELNDSVIILNDSSTLCTPVKTTSRNHSISELSGTPVLKFSPYNQLPSGEKFSVGVCDVINFENLPDSTGKYEQMRGVLGKVREKLKRLHGDDN